MKKLLHVLRGRPAEVPPIWLMRQAGRYLPEYRALRERAGSFLDLCYTPELAEEVTLQPIRRFGFDGAILFADILLIAQALGQELTFVEGEGPRLSPPVDSVARLAVLRDPLEVHERLAPVYETVRRLRRSLPGSVTLIGFAGAPWTVASYMVEGRGSADQAAARRWMYRDAKSFGSLVDLVTEATIEYLSHQIEAGAEAVKIFDSWAGSLAPEPYRQWVVRPTARIVRKLGERFADVPVIGFPRGAGVKYIEFARDTKAGALALDTGVPLEWARRELQGVTDHALALQGNFDPLLLVAGGERMTTEARRMVEAMRSVPYVFNLGHGVLPETDPGNIARLVAAVRG